MFFLLSTPNMGDVCHCRVVQLKGKRGAQVHGVNDLSFFMFRCAILFG